MRTPRRVPTPILVVLCMLAIRSVAGQCVDVLGPETFEGGLLPEWRVISTVGNFGESTWNTKDFCGPVLPGDLAEANGNDGEPAGRRLERPFVVIDTFCNPQPSYGELLFLPPVEVVEFDVVKLCYSEQFLLFDNVLFDVLVSFDRGETLHDIFNSGDQPRGKVIATRRELDVPIAAVPDEVARAIFVFRYRGGPESGFWAIDDVTVLGCRAQQRFTRGDTNCDGDVDISDGIFIFTYLFVGGGTPCCLAAADTAAEGNVSITSGIRLLNHLFLGFGPPAPPFGVCGPLSPRDESVGCDVSPPMCR